MPCFQTSENPDLQNIIIHNGSLCFAFTDSFLSEKTEWNLYYWDSVIATIPCFLIFLGHGCRNLDNSIHMKSE